MEFENKKYGVFDYIKIPFKIAPITTFFMVALKVFIAAIPSMQVFATSTFVDRAIDIFNNGGRERIYFPLFLVMLLIALSWLSSMILGFVRLNLDLKMNEEITLGVVKKRSRLDYRYVEDNDTWDLISRVGDNAYEKFKGAFDNLLNIIEYVVRIGSLVFIILTQVWWVAIVILVISVPSMMFALKSGEDDYEAFEESSKYLRRAAYLQEVLSSREKVEERALFGFTNKVNKMWIDRFDIGRKIYEKAQKTIFIKMKGASIITAIVSMSAALALLPSVKNKDITVGMYMSLVTATFSLVEQISWQLSMILQDYAKNKLYLRDFSKFSSLGEAEGSDLAPDIRVQGVEFQTIEFKNVTFKYPGTERKILNGLSMRLDKNKQYAFVGKNGAGKTTITKLLTGLYKDYEGEILINGKDIKSFTGAELKAYFSVVYQDFARYHISLRDNVLIGNCGYSFNEEEKKILVESALTKMELEDEIKVMPQGIDTPLGMLEENSLDLSGGQWQRVAIARTLLNNAPINILDEPTAALDPISESKIYKLFSDISKERTTILITHRLGAARIADEILVVEDGKIAEQGSHKELLHKKGIYSEMFEAQRSWYDEEEK